MTRVDGLYTLRGIMITKTTKKKSTSKKKAKAHKSLDIVNVKMTSADRRRMIANAKKWAGGNVSAWLRYAGKAFTPKRGEKIPQSAF